MEDISSILASFDIKKITEQYCDDLRSQREGKLVKKEREKLEHIIRKFRNENQDVVLGAIVIYAIFYPNEAIQYARQKGVFYYGSEWAHTESCLESLNSLSEILHIPQLQQKFFQQKLSCRWLGRFYLETEEKLKRDIRRHYRERIKKELHGVPYESSLIIELLAYINMIFRYRNASTAQVHTMGSPNKNNKCVSDYTNEEISEAASYLIYLFTEERGFQPKKEKWLDIDYILYGRIDKLVLLACHRNLILEWEFLVDCLGYELEAGEKSIRIYDPDDQLEKSFRIGLIKTSMQEQLSAMQIIETTPIGLQELAQMTVTELGDTLFEWRCEDKLFQRYRMAFPEPLLDPLLPKKNDGALGLFREEYIELYFANHELTFKSADIFNQMVTNHCSVVDLILFKRFFILFNFSQRWLFEKETDIRKVIPSLIPIMSEEQLIDLIEKFVDGKEKAGELLELLSWDGHGKLDLQYTPIIKIDSKHYYVATDILISSNIARNSLVLARGKKISAANSDGQNDPLEIFCEKSFRECSFPYQTRSNVKYKYRGEQGEIDFLAWSDSRIYIIECKKAILPSSSHEIRATYEHIQKASQQLDMSSEALQDEMVQKNYFPQWGISSRSRTIHTCILLGNRLFAVPNGMQHPVRYAYELNMILTSGTVNSNLGHWSCWTSEQFADEDLARYLSDADPLSRSFLESMDQYMETFCCQGKKIQLSSYAYNPLLHLEKHDEHLRIIDKNEEERKKLDEQFLKRSE